MRKLLLNITSIIFFLILHGCVSEDYFVMPQNICPEPLSANTTIDELKGQYEGGIQKIKDDLVIEGFVVSSDEKGNFYGGLYIQDRAIDPSGGIRIALDQLDLFRYYPPGQKIWIKLKGLYLDESKGLYSLGSVFQAFGNDLLGRIPANLAKEHLIPDCGQQAVITASRTSIENLNEQLLNTLVQLDDLSVVEEELGSTFAFPGEETIRELTDCDGKRIYLVNSGYSDFQDEQLPQGTGGVIGILQKAKGTYGITIRDPEDMSMDKPRCITGPISSTQFFITELADPDNNSGARFLELFNSAEERLNLEGWQVRRYTNANQTAGTITDLTGLFAEPGQSILLASNAEIFKATYGFEPDLEAGLNSAADSNGDDNIELVDPFGVVIDVFGRIGEDGSGTDHEFEDGRAVRKSFVVRANPSYTPSEWIVYNDTGASGTTNAPQQAPENFTPGVRD